MKNSLFITGASGFIASNFLRRVDLQQYKNIYCLSRTESKTITSLSVHDNFKFIKANIFDSHLYATALASTDVVVHLAAATGKVAREEYFTTNTKGTQFFLEQCKQAGVKNFLHVSTIAVKFPDKSRYYYAQSKELAESAVRSSGINYTIVRPTIVIGQDAAIWKSLLKIVNLPIMPIFGDGTTRIQPIYIEDLVNCLLLILYENIFANETMELGGPEEITFESFLKKIHYLYYEKEPLLIHIPLKPLIRFLSIFEKSFYAILPISAGQLYAFGNDGTIKRDRVFSHQVSQMKNVQEMLRLVRGHA